MDLYAKRARVEREPCKPDGPEMLEFCKGFEHQPTKDQVSGERLAALRAFRPLPFGGWRRFRTARKGRAALARPSQRLPRKSAQSAHYLLTAPSEIGSFGVPCGNRKRLALTV